MTERSDGNLYRCENCGNDTPTAVQITPDPETSPIWCHDCAYAEIPEYRAFVDEISKPDAS